MRDLRLFPVLLLLLACLIIHCQSTDRVSDYQRSAFGSWIDVDGDCQSTRHEVLIRDSLAPVEFQSTRHCMVKKGLWISPYTGQKYTQTKYLDIDHVVPLKEAWDSGARFWSRSQRVAFANDLWPGHLVVSYRGLNRSKGSRDLSGWLPPANKCWYIKNWLEIKTQYGLEIDTAEQEVLQKYSNVCAR